MTQETSPSLPAEVYPAELLDDKHHVIAAGHVRTTRAGRGIFEMGLLDEPARLAAAAAFLRCGTQEPKRLTSIRHEAAVPFHHFHFEVEK